ncbi:hypothetical protein CPB83DRAFT_863060 [Crepidotus variabilis]|uniref:Uncharacterized protein n=1 Tax=Crepidotus variabilis TaxID=179855 RepID=A0A9P6E654_9AGAR|nr:hypothetical protein CPB83DRAFT_863060 [Crepidotus variabilis]
MPFPNPVTVCQEHQLADGPHTLRLNLIGSPTTNVLIFDHIQYVPSPHAISSKGAIIFQNNDPDLEYGPGWNHIDNATMTNQTGSMVAFDFVGTLVSAFTILPKEFFEWNSMPGSYSIDNGSSKSFDQTGHLSRVVAYYNQRLFESPPLASGHHKLAIIYAGNSEINPLYLLSDC